MSKPITEWGEAEVRAMFSGLPDGALIIRKGDSLVVANAGTVESSCETECDDLDYRPPWNPSRIMGRTYTLTCELTNAQGRSDHNLVEYALPESVKISKGDAAAMRGHIQEVTDYAKRIGLF